jgi:signal transduction histidine kinase
LLTNNIEDIDHLREDISKTKKGLSLDFIIEDMQEAIKESLEGTNRISNIVQALRTFSNIDSEEYMEVDLNKGIESSLVIAQSELKEGIEISKELAPLPQIKCHPQQINQVILNLLINAIHAIEEKGTITIRSYYDNKNVYVQICDTGKGIKPEHLRKIFDPFFTTEKIGKGPGLGLSTSYNIIKKQNGEIRVESELGKRTCFTIIIPRKSL